jgi:hypothetical protein
MHLYIHAQFFLFERIIWIHEGLETLGKSAKNVKSPPVSTRFVYETKA